MPLDRILNELKGSASAQGALGGAASGALVSLLVNKKARKAIGGSALKVGTAAAVAGVGYLAYKKWQETRGPGKLPATATASTPAPAGPTRLSEPAPALPAPATAPVVVSDTLATHMALVMMAAAHADGTIDSRELDALAGFLDTAELPAAEKTRLTAALNEPPGFDAIAALAANLEEASELYAAALSAIDLDTPAEHLFLRRLARSFGLDDALVAALHQTARTSP